MEHPTGHLQYGLFAHTMDDECAEAVETIDQYSARCQLQYLIRM